MSLLRARAAVSPLRRSFQAADPLLPAVADLVAVERPEERLSRRRAVRGEVQP